MPHQDCFIDEDGVKRFRFPSQEEIDNGTAVFPWGGRSTVYERKYLAQGKVYIIDEPDATLVEDPTPPEGRQRKKRRAQDHHMDCCTDARDFFEHYTDYDVVGVPSMARDAWNLWWTAEIESWEADDMIIIWYQGDAGTNGNGYEWHIRNKPVHINADRFLMKLAGAARCNILVILECYVPSRYKNKQDFAKIIESSEVVLEVVSCGQPGQHRDGVQMATKFSDHLFDKMAALADVEASKQGLSKISPQGWSVLELLRRDKELVANPLRLELAPKESSTGDDTQDDFKVKRLRLDKHHIQHHQKVIFCVDTVKDQQLVELVEANRKARELDEGFVGDERGYTRSNKRRKDTNTKR